jgi:signal transduction histidine kinase
VLLAAAAVLVLSLAVIFWMERAAIQGNRNLAAQREVTARLERLASTLTDAETGQRGYVLTRDPRYLEPYHLARVEVNEALDHLSAVAARKELPDRQVSEIRRLSDEELGELEQAVKFTQEGSSERALEIVRSSRGKELMDTIRSDLARMEADQEAAIEGADRRAAGSARERVWAFPAAALLNLIVLAWGYRRITQERRARETAEAALQRAGEELAQVNVALEQKVQERTAQLVEANASLQTFANTVAHDLRSPLGAICSFAGIALQKYGPKLDEMGRALLEGISQSAEQTTRLLHDLLEFSKMSQAELKLVRLSLKTTVANALTLQDSEIRAKNALVSAAGPLPEVIGHPATVTLLINNLVSNALKFTQPGVTPQIQIRAELRDNDPSPAGGHPASPMPPPDSAQTSAKPPLETPGQMVRLWIEDNGIGIAPEHREQIFGAFQRVHGKQAYPGTGLGLAIVKKGAERMAGRTGVESEIGKASRFWIELPAAS